MFTIILISWDQPGEGQKSGAATPAAKGSEQWSNECKKHKHFMNREGLMQKPLENIDLRMLCMVLLTK